MRGASNRKIIFLLCGILVILILFGQTFSAKAVVKSTPKTTLIIGDSIAYGMALGKKYGTGVDGADRVYWLAEGGVNISLLHPDFKIHLGRVMPKRIVNTLTSARDFDLLREVKKKKIEDIVIILGANWPSEKSAKLIVNCLKKLEKKSCCRVYYVNILPYVHKGKYENRTSMMTYHNKLTRKGFKNTGIVYIDAYRLAKSVKNYYNFTWDGIHYSKKVYNVVFKKLLSVIEKEKFKNLTGSDKRQKTVKKNEK